VSGSAGHGPGIGIEITGPERNRTPEVRSLEGFAEEALALFLEASGESGRDARARAEEAFGEAIALGQRDGPTLGKWVEVNASARPHDALRRLELLGREPGVVWDARLWTLRAQLLSAFPERFRERQRACREAQALARTPDDVAAVERTCR
jgi:hypothetical protein